MDARKKSGADFFSDAILIPHPLKYNFFTLSGVIRLILHPQHSILLFMGVNLFLETPELQSKCVP